MSQAKLQAAKELIQEKDYDAARSVLRTIPNDPTAIKWLAKLDQLAPPAPVAVPPSMPPKSRGFDWPMAIVILIIIAVVGYFGLMIYQQHQASSRNAAAYVCGLTYTQYSPQWQNCVDDK